MEKADWMDRYNGRGFGGGSDQLAFMNADANQRMAESAENSAKCAADSVSLANEILALAKSQIDESKIENRKMLLISIISCVIALLATCFEIIMRLVLKF